ncbi:MAG: hypothetical protein HXY41_06765 [Chloroflexi bacterium]|nr:hypothetical protein [Chloroflexota bacterium]
MNATFLSNFMRLALQKTGADRAMATDGNLSIVATINLEQADLLSSQFAGIEAIRQALDEGEPIITNNAVMDPTRAPVTNTNFSNLRVVVVIPVEEYGAVYLDQHIRKGVIPKEVVNRLWMVAGWVVNKQQMDIGPDELEAVYEQTESL